MTLHDVMAALVAHWDDTLPHLEPDDLSLITELIPQVEAAQDDVQAATAAVSDLTMLLMARLPADHPVMNAISGLIRYAAAQADLAGIGATLRTIPGIEFRDIQPRPSRPEPSLPPGRPESSLPPGQPEPSLSPGKPESSLPPGQPEPSLPPGQPEPSLSPGQPEPSLSPGQPESSLPPGKPEPPLLPDPASPPPDLQPDPPDPATTSADAMLLAAPALTAQQVRENGSDPDSDELIRLTAASGAVRLPAFQFGSDGRPIRVVVKINRLLQADEDPWGVADWWLGANAWLNAVPADLLGQIDDELLTLAARAELVQG
jgi:hypothetical protein